VQRNEVQEVAERQDKRGRVAHPEHLIASSVASAS
jgi:hypothetical protein